MKKLTLLTTIVLLTLNSFATHNMAGDISYTHVSGLTYRFTVRTFCNTNNTQADRCQLLLNIGTADSIVLPRINGISSLCPSTHDGVMLCTGVKYNVYQGDYTFAANGTYAISMVDPNRDAGICNVANSVNTPFSLAGELVVNPVLGNDDSPQYVTAALIDNNVGTISDYNPNIINTSGDSLYFDFELGAGQTLPPASTSITINHHTGEIIWNAPNTICNYVLDVSLKQYKIMGGMAYYVGSTFQEIFTNNCISSLAINENNNSDEITLYPNPTTDIFTITSTNRIQSIKVFDVMGQCVLAPPPSLQGGGKGVVIDMSGFAKGIYFVQITDGGSAGSPTNVVSRKIVVQ